MHLAPKLFLLMAFLAPLSPASSGRNPDEPLFDELTKVFKKKYLSFGILVQAIADFQKDPPRRRIMVFASETFA